MIADSPIIQDLRLMLRVLVSNIHTHLLTIASQAASVLVWLSNRLNTPPHSETKAAKASHSARYGRSRTYRDGISVLMTVPQAEIEPRA